MTQQATLNTLGSALVSRIEYIDNSDARPVHLSADGVTSYFVRQKQLFTSTDDGTTLQGPWWTLPVAGTNTGIVGVVETADGEILCTCFKAQGNYAGLWKSTGWANKATATFTEVLTPSGQLPSVADPATFPSPAGTSGDRSNYFTPRFGFHAYGDGTVIVNEYGKQANGSTVVGARYVFVSTSNGAAGTWRLARDFWGGPPYTTPGNVLPFGSATNRDHMHGAIYDPFTGRLWFTGGDSGHHTEWAPSVAAAIADPYNANGTWTVIPASSPYLGTTGGQPGTTQCVTPWPLPDRILMTTDGQIDGVVSVEKSDSTFGTLLAPHGIGLPHTSALQYTGCRPFQRDSLSHSPTYKPRFPLVLPFYVGSGGAQTIPAIITIADPLGRRFYDSYVDTLNLPNPYGVYSAVGPTARGKLLASIALDGRSAGQVTDQAGYTFMRADFPTIV